MRPAENIEKLIKNAEIDTNAGMDDFVLNDVLKVLEKSKGKKLAVTQPNIWRIIMKKPITKLATAAVIILIAVFGITVLDQSVAPAYAIEQTIEAFRTIKTVHILCRDWEDNKFDVWLKLDPNTGKETHLYAIVPSFGSTIISEPNRTYVYNKKNNFVQVYDFKMAKSDISFTNLFESIVEDVVELKDTDNINIYKYRDSETNNDYIVIDVNTEKQEMKILVDPQTKLPVKINRARSEEMGDVLKNADEFNYNVVIPDELSHFQIPSDARIINASKERDRIADPNFGMHAGDLEEDDAMVAAAEQYWEAVSEANWEKVKILYPALSELTDEKLKTMHKRSGLIKSVEVGQPYKQRGLSMGKITPCTITYTDGESKQVKMITILMKSGEYRYCVISGTWAQ